MTNSFFLILVGHFLPFDPPNNLKNQSFEKITKVPEDIMILHLNTTNDDHMMYGSWDVEHDRQNSFVIFNYFLPFYPPNNPEIKILRKWKKCL